MAECLREKTPKHTHTQKLFVFIFILVHLLLQPQNLKTLELLKEGIFTTSQVISKSLNFWGVRKVLIIKHRVD